LKNRRKKAEEAAVKLLKIYGSYSPSFIGPAAGTANGLTTEDALPLETILMFNYKQTKANKPAFDLDAVEKLGYDFLKVENHYVSTAGLLERAKEIEPSGDKQPLLPGDIFSLMGFSYVVYKDLLMPNGNPFAIGVGKSRNPQAPSTVQAYQVFYDGMPPSVTKEDADNSLVPITVYRTERPTYQPSSLDTELVSLFINSVPSVERAKCVPYFSIALSSNKSAKSAGGILGITTSRHLMGAFKPDAYKNFIEAPFIPRDSSATEEELFQNNSMGVFSSPQTMIPHGRNIFKKSDPFRPLLTIESFSLKETMPSKGMEFSMSKRSGTLKMVLHDRTRMPDIAEMLQVGGISSSKAFEITWGWAHPDGNLLNIASQASKMSNLYGELIDGMRQTEIFTVSNVSFDMGSNGEVNIIVPLMSMGSGKSLKGIDITDGGSDALTEAQLIKMIDSVSLSPKAFGETFAPPGTIANIGSKTTSAASDKRKLVKKSISKSLKKSLTEVQQKMADDQNLTTGQLAKLFGEIVKTNKVDDELVSDLVSTNRKNVLSGMITELENRQSDPFLRPRLATTPVYNNIKVAYDVLHSAHGTNIPPSVLKDTLSQWVSLGQIITWFVGSALSKAYSKELSEIQFVFHGFNSCAGACYDYSLAGMPIYLPTLKKVLKEEYSNPGALSLDGFINVLDENFINNEKSPAYGITDKSTIDKEKYETDEMLNRIYALDPKDPSPEKFKRPKLSVKYDIRPGLSGFPGSDDSKSIAPILRMHFYDTQAGKGEFASKVLTAVKEETLFFPIMRPPADTIGTVAPTNRHAFYESMYLDPFDKFMEDISEDQIEEFKKGLPKDLTPDQSEEAKKILDLVRNRAFRLNLPPGALKRLLSSIYPPLFYGGTNSGITSAKVSSIKDADNLNLEIVRKNKKSSKARDILEEESDEVIEVYPVKVSMETLGCPFISSGQQFYVDFGTNSSIDDVYRVTSVTHSIKPGSFTTSMDFAAAGSGGTIKTTKGSVMNLLSKAINRGIK
jgi:hypothetical protein